ncbi:unnamed protein product [Somion occarium]|uniref:MARVEL domain-containing protein n=1 Tax=Somion occarium TaxID=3059160 RepID=A0ABP1DAN2_9APHY
MRCPFLTLRFVIFAIAMYLNILAFGFSIWNIVAMKDAGVSGAPLFIIFNSCALVFFLLLAVAELVIPSAKTAQVSFECLWTGALSTLQLAAALNITIRGPPIYCGSQSSEAICGSSFVLVVLTWISCTSLLVYFLALLVTALSHWKSYRGVWSTTVYNVPWFTERDVPRPPSTRPVSMPTPPKPFKLKAQKMPYVNPLFNGTDDDLPLSPPRAPFADIEKGLSGTRPTLPHESSRETFRPTWAKSLKVRRGLDHPFGAPKTRPITAIIKSYWSPSSAPSPPPKPTPLVLPKLDLSLDMNGPHYRRESQTTRSSYSQFPAAVANPDRPIEFGRLSEWVRADMAAGINVHSTPQLTPR